MEDCADGKSRLEFATEAYNYNTMNDADPRNLVLLCTSQGMAVQQDGRGTKQLFHHAVDGEGQIHRYWLEAEESRHKVGGEQRETLQERAEALIRGKATSSVIGIQAMGQRFNVLMTIQVPLQQQRGGAFGMAVPFGMFGAVCAGGAAEMEEEDDLYGFTLVQACPRSARSAPSFWSSMMPTRGTTSAARVSRGTEHDIWAGLSIKSPKRHASEHVTVTVVIYNAVKGGVPSQQDVPWGPKEP